MNIAANNQQTNTPTIKPKGFNLTLITIAFITLSLLIFAISTPFNTLLGRFDAFTYSIEHVIVKSEYTLGEQMSKVYLLFTLLIGLYAYPRSTSPNKVLLSIGYIVLGLVTYIAESNMITELTQPILGIGLIGLVMFLLFKHQQWLSFLTIGTGVFILSLGSLTDLFHQYRHLFARFEPLPDFFLNPPEELFDLIGVTLICMSAAYCFYSEIIDFVKTNLLGFLLLVLSIFIVSFGNGLLHYSYAPSNNFHLTALAMSIVGFLLFAFADYRFIFLNKEYQNFIYPSFAVFFIVLPSVFQQARNSIVFLIWIPFVITIALTLWKYHPINLRPNTNQA